ncbi:MAG: hypothetical protein H8D94_00155 [Candidatus Pelagibacter sp.]|nr:hypothetical protein [Candidatus Pelagibacter sp.]
MAYMSQERKKLLSPKIKEICKRHGIKATLGVDNYSTLILNINSGSIDFYKDATFRANIGSYDIYKGYFNLNNYWYKEHFTGKALDFLSEVIPAMNNGNFDKSDIMTDYFHVGWYISVNVGRWNKPYTLI